MTNVVSNYLKYANLQMVAETILPADFTGRILATTLGFGNNRSSKFSKETLNNSFLISPVC